MKVAVLCDFYLPGFKAGGPVRTLANMVEVLGDEIEFLVITRDRDVGDITPYPGVKVGSFTKVGKAQVFYLRPSSLSFRVLHKVICASDHDMLYLNSFFSPIFTMVVLILRRMGLIPKVPIVVAPRGELSSGALGLKSLKKHVYLHFSKLMNFWRDVVWQASSEYEEQDIRKWFGDNVSVEIAPDLPLYVGHKKDGARRCQKTVGHLKVVFLARISRMKNLGGALRILRGLTGEIQFNIYGPIEDREYWSECEGIIRHMPCNIKVRYCGPVPYHQVDSIIMEHHLFFLPTLGENFGHAIVEALINGCPVLISEHTPWRGLEKKRVGWDLPIENPERYRSALHECVDMDNQTYQELRKRVRHYGQQLCQDESVLQSNRVLLYRACGQAIT